VLGAEPVRGLGGTLDTTRAIELVRRKIDEFQFNLDPSAQVERISVAARQKVEILKLLYRNVSVLIWMSRPRCLRRRRFPSSSPS